MENLMKYHTIMKPLNRTSLENGSLSKAHFKDQKLMDLIFYMMHYTQKSYRNQKEIAQGICAYYSKYGIKATQSGVSKAMNNLMVMINYKNSWYGFARNAKNEYTLISFDNIHNVFLTIKEEIYEDDVILMDKMCKVSDSVFMYKIKPSSIPENISMRYEKAKNYFCRMIHKDALFDIILYNDMIVVMLQHTHPKFSTYSRELSNLLPSKKDVYI